MKLFTQVTEVMAFCDCRRRWYWEYIEGWRSKAPQWQFIVGQLVHSGLEAYYKVGGGLQQALGALSSEGYRISGELARDQQGVWESMSHEYETQYDLAKNVLQNYLLFDSTEPLDEIGRAHV